jgi:hypothetical protein
MVQGINVKYRLRKLNKLIQVNDDRLFVWILKTLPHFGGRVYSESVFVHDPQFFAKSDLVGGHELTNSRSMTLSNCDKKLCDASAIVMCEKMPQ